MNGTTKARVTAALYERAGESKRLTRHRATENGQATLCGRATNALRGNVAIKPGSTINVNCKSCLRVGA